MHIKYKTGDWVWAFEKSIYPPTSSKYTSDGCIIYAPIHHIEIARKYFHSGSGPAAKYLDMGDYVTYCFDVYGKIIKITDLCVPDNNDHTFRFGKCVNVASTFAEIEPYIDKESVVKHMFADTRHTSVLSSSCNAPAEEYNDDGDEDVLND